MNEWTPEQDAVLREMYYTHTREEIALAVGRTEGAVRSHCYYIGLNTKGGRPWTPTEDEKLTLWLSKRNGKMFNAKELAEYMGRSENAVSLRLSRLGLGDRCRVNPDGRKDRRKFKGDNDAARKSIGEHMKEYIRENGHPKGFLGHRHSDEAKYTISVKVKFSYMRMSPEKISKTRQKTRGTNMSRYGTYAPHLRNRSNPYSRARGGKREDLDNRYFRSAWEANYARYLNFLKEHGEITAWDFEPEIFYFEGVKRAPLSYTPDFKITENDGSTVYHEVKGWMDSKSRSKLKRMAKFYPQVKIVIIDGPVYKSISDTVRGLIPNWEFVEGHAW